jgi:hypothetical protein
VHRRVMFGIDAFLALGYALVALRAVWLSLIESARAPEMPGLFPILAFASGAVGFALAREALASRDQSSPLREWVPLTRTCTRHRSRGRCGPSRVVG